MTNRWHKKLLIFFCALIAAPLCCPAQSAPPYQYFRTGNAAPAHAVPHAGFALMGGGTDLDEAFQWLCDHAGGGDLLVLRATGTDAYNPYIQKLCPRLNSVATLVIPNRAAAEDPFVAQTIAHASALFLSGGDQSNYINFWMHSPVQRELNAAIARGVPIGGTSAGLAVLSEWAYSAQGDKPNDSDLSSALAMSDPFGPRITLVRGFLNIPLLHGILTDTHFARRDRMGRLLVFLARLRANNPAIRGIGVEQGAAVLLDPNGQAQVVGHGDAYFIDAPSAHGTVTAGKPLTFGPYAVQKVAPGHAFDIRTWGGESTTYQLTVRNGTIMSTQTDGAAY